MVLDSILFEGTMKALLTVYILAIYQCVPPFNRLRPHFTYQIILISDPVIHIVSLSTLSFHESNSHVIYNISKIQKTVKL